MNNRKYLHLFKTSILAIFVALTLFVTTDASAQCYGCGYGGGYYGYRHYYRPYPVYYWHPHHRHWHHRPHWRHHRHW